MTDATVQLNALAVDLQVTTDPWLRYSPYENWKVFYRLVSWPVPDHTTGYATFSVRATTTIAMPDVHQATRMAVLK